MKATLPRGEAYEFLELGDAPRACRRHRRACSPSRCRRLTAAEPAAVTHERLSSLLKSCGAFEAFRKQEQRRAAARAGRRLPAARAAACRARSASASSRRSQLDPRDLRATPCGPRWRSAASSPSSRSPSCATLDASTELLLERVIRGLGDAADEIAAAYFTTRVIPPGPYAQQTAAAAMYPPRRAHDGVQLRRPDRRGLHGAAPAPARGRRPALLLVPADDRAARPARARVPRPLRQRRAPLRRARVARPARGHGRQRGDDAERRSQGGRQAPTPLELHDYLAPTELRALLPRACRSSPPATQERPPARERAQALMERGPRRARLRPERDRRPDARRRGARARPRRLPGLRARAARAPAAASASRRATSAATSTTRSSRATTRPRTRGSTCGTRSGAGSRSTPRTTASRPRATCASPSAGTTPTCRRRAASTRATPRETLAVRVGLQAL